MPTPSPRSPRKRKAAIWAAWVLAAMVLAGVFLAYLDPHTVADLSNRFWSCF